jgi:hypothetical protein
LNGRTPLGIADAVHGDAKLVQSTESLYLRHQETLLPWSHRLTGMMAFIGWMMPIDRKSDAGT